MGASKETQYESTNNEDADATTANVNGKLVNPFKGKRPEQMDNLIKEFMKKTEIDEMFTDLIRKGAFLAQDSEAFMHPRTDGLQLNQKERHALEQENLKTGNK